MVTKVTGRENTLRRLKAIQAAPRPAIRAALKAGAEEITALQKQTAPRDSGDLANSIGYTFGNYKAENANVRGVHVGGDGDPDLTVTIHAGDAKAYYAAWVEHGTAARTAGGMFASASVPAIRAQPFFYPSYRMLKRRTSGRITRAMNKAIKQAAGK